MEIKKRLQLFFYISFCLFPFLFGLYYEFTAYIAGAIITALFIWSIVKAKTIKLSKKWGFILLVGSYLFYLITVPFAVDHGMAFAGFLKVLPIPMFLVLLLQFDKNTRESCLKLVPRIGEVMLVLSLFAWVIPGIQDFFFNNGRLGGFFQYSNTFALYLLLGLIILGKKKQKTKGASFEIGVLFFGILLTGSRSVFVMTLLNLIFIVITEKTMRKPIAIITGIMTAGVGLFFMMSNDPTNIGRFLTISLQESTFLGRLLYNKDALKLVLQNPFGLGYYGGFSLQPSTQAGVYTVRFIHNDWLQLALDAGIIALICHLIGLFKGIKKSGIMQKQLFITLLLSSLFDFNLQFGAVAMTLMLTLDYEVDYELQTDLGYKTSLFLASAMMIIFLYFSIAFGGAYFGEYTAAIRLYGGNTEAKIAALKITEDPDVLNARSEDILKQNTYVSDAYDAMAYNTYLNQDYDRMIVLKKKAIKNRKYDIKVYQEYLYMLSQAIEAANSQGQSQELKKYVEEIIEIPKMLDVVKAQTDPIAYLINDKPQLDLSEEEANYIKELEMLFK